MVGLVRIIPAFVVGVFEGLATGGVTTVTVIKASTIVTVFVIVEAGRVSFVFEAVEAKAGNFMKAGG